MAESAGLARDQLRVLNEVLDHRIEQKKWPTLLAVERKLRKELDAIRILESIRSPSGYHLTTHNPMEAIILPFELIALCERAEEFYAIMPRLIAVMWEIYVTTEEKPTLKADDLRSRGWTPADIADAFRMLYHESPFSGSGSHTDDQSWDWDIRNTIRDYKDVQTPREYIETRKNEIEQRVQASASTRSLRPRRASTPPLLGLPFGLDADPISRGRVFIVHGHDHALKTEVARTLEQLRLEPIILHEQVDGGKTIIEKLEIHADVDYAVVLITPDDELRDTLGRITRRARQNVILELGFFLAELGRDRVFILRRDVENLETPSDYDGVVYARADADGAWKYRLAKELRSAGFDADSNLLT